MLESSPKAESLVSPRLALRVIRRVGNGVVNKVIADHKARAETSAADLVLASQLLHNQVSKLAPAGVGFVAVEFPTDSGYGRQAQEESGCPILRAKHGHYGRFLLAQYTGDTTFRATLYEDATKSNQDILTRTRYDLPLNGSLFSHRFPDVSRARDTRLQNNFQPEVCSLAEINDLSSFLAKSTISFESNHMATVTRQYDARVAQYSRSQQNDVSRLIPHQLTYSETANQSITL